MAHKKGNGSTKNGRDSIGKHLGLKLQNNTFVHEGEIIVRQRGLKKNYGLNVGISKDFSLFALKSGFLEFVNNKIFIKEYI